jgi:hypothetical protein
VIASGIDRGALAALTPAKRAEVIYGAAQSELSQRLWQAALGSNDRAQDSSDSVFAPAAPTTRAQQLDALIAAMTGEQQATGAAPAMRPAVLYTESAMPAPATVAGPSLDGLGANSRYRGTLQAAAARTNLPASALAAIVDAEAGKGRDGSWQVYSRNPRSSAAGLGQFLSRTWEGMATIKGTWLNQFARAQGWLDGGGKVLPGARSALLSARYDPTAAINGIADYARHNLDGLRRQGVSVDGDVTATARLAYLGHHLGLGDAARFLRNGGLGESRARTVLAAQVGSDSSQRRIATSGDATAAHRDWLLGYLDRKIQPARFGAMA